MLKIPYRLLFPAIVLFCCIGTYGIANSLFNVWLMMGCALIGYFFIKIGVEPAPLLLGLVLGPQLEENFRRAMLIADGDFSVFLSRADQRGDSRRRRRSVAGDAVAGNTENAEGSAGGMRAGVSPAMASGR